MPERTHYQILGVARDANRKTIRAAYRKALRNYHPDANAGDRCGEAMLRRVITAGRILSDDKKRFRYDRTLSKFPPPEKSPPGATAPTRKHLSGSLWKRLAIGSRRIARRFFTAAAAAGVNQRAQACRPKKTPGFGFFLFLALRGNLSGRYQPGADGVYRRTGKRKGFKRNRKKAAPVQPGC